MIPFDAPSIKADFCISLQKIVYTDDFVEVLSQ